MPSFINGTKYVWIISCKYYCNSSIKWQIFWGELYVRWIVSHPNFFKKCSSRYRIVIRVILLSINYNINWVDHLSDWGLDRLTFKQVLHVYCMYIYIHVKNMFRWEHKGPYTQAIFAAIFLLLMRSFSFWCMRLNGLTYECIRPSVESYINQYFCDSTTQTHASEWEKSPQKSPRCAKMLQL